MLNSTLDLGSSIQIFLSTNWLASALVEEILLLFLCTNFLNEKFSHMVNLVMLAAANMEYVIIKDGRS